MNRVEHVGFSQQTLPVPMPGVRTRAARRPAARSAQTLTGKTEVPFATDPTLTPHSAVEYMVGYNTVGQLIYGLATTCLRVTYMVYSSAVKRLCTTWGDLYLRGKLDPKLNFDPAGRLNASIS